MLQEILCYTFIECFSCVSQGSWYVWGGDYPEPTCIHFLDVTGSPEFSVEGDAAKNLCSKAPSPPTHSTTPFPLPNLPEPPLQSSSSTPFPTFASFQATTIPTTIKNYIVTQAQIETNKILAEFNGLFGVALFSLVSSLLCWFFGEDLNTIKRRMRSCCRLPVSAPSSPQTPPIRRARSSRDFRGRAPSPDPQRTVVAQEQGIAESRLDSVMRMVGLRRGEGIDRYQDAGPSTPDRRRLERVDEGNGGDVDNDVESVLGRRERAGSVSSFVGSESGRMERAASVLSDDGSVMGRESRAGSVVGRGSRGSSVMRFLGFGGEEEVADAVVVDMGGENREEQQQHIGYFRRLSHKLEKAVGAAKIPQIYQVSYHRESSPNPSEEDCSFHSVQNV